VRQLQHNYFWSLVDIPVLLMRVSRDETSSVGSKAANVIYLVCILPVNRFQERRKVIFVVLTFSGTQVWSSLREPETRHERYKPVDSAQEEHDPEIDFQCVYQ
jgi:hypothetical protein